MKTHFFEISFFVGIFFNFLILYKIIVLMQNYLINLITICAEKESKHSQIWGHFMGKNEKSPYLQ